MDNARILVVDDDEDSRILVERVLKRNHFLVETAANGKEALEIVNTLLVDLIVLDVMMPGMDGYQVYNTLKESDATRNIPVIMLTALNKADHIERALHIAPDWYITKPFDPKYLLKRIRQVLFKAGYSRSLTQ